MGPPHSPRGIRYYPLSVIAELCTDQLNIRFIFSQNLHKEANIERLAVSFLNSLRKLITDDHVSVG